MKARTGSRCSCTLVLCFFVFLVAVPSSSCATATTTAGIVAHERSTMMTRQYRKKKTTTTTTKTNQSRRHFASIAAVVAATAIAITGEQHNNNHNHNISCHLREQQEQEQKQQGKPKSQSQTPFFSNNKTYPRLSPRTNTKTGVASRIPNGGGGFPIFRKKEQPTPMSLNHHDHHHDHPSFYWALLHNWLYFLSLGFNATNIPYIIRSIVDGGSRGQEKPSPAAIALSGNVEAVDRMLTFLGIGVLSSLSDKFGRRPLMAWSAAGFMVTNLIQANTVRSIPMLYLADFVDGCSSCMLPLCQAYVTDCSPPSKRATNLGIFQGLTVGLAFILAFPIGGILGVKFGPRVPLLVAAALQALNALIILFITPESNTAVLNSNSSSSSNKKPSSINWNECNPAAGLVRLFGRAPLLRTAAAAYFLASLARNSLDAQFINYSSLRFGWTQAQSGPVLVLVGLMLAVAPRLLVPVLGLRHSILSGLLVTAVGLLGTGLSPTPTGFVGSIFVVSVGCVCFPALQALLASLAPPGERGATLGAVASLVELTAAIGSTMYAGILSWFTSDVAPVRLPGAAFLLGAVLLVIAWMFSVRGFGGPHRLNDAWDTAKLDNEFD